MIKVKLLIIIFLNFLLLFAPFGSVKSSLAASGCETRGTWLNPNAFNSDTRRTETLNKIKQANLNTVFLAAYTLDGNYGWSQKADFDQFYTMLRQNNISVHVWVANMYRISGVDFTDPVERTAQKNWAMSWFNHYPDLDGFHLDYIRYVWGDGKIYADKMKAVNNTVETIYNGIKSQYPNKKLSAAVFSSCKDYTHTEEQNAIPLWFKTWFNNHPNNYYYDNYDGNIHRTPIFMSVNQDPVTWITSNYINTVIPMQYTTDDSKWNTDADQWKSFLIQNGNYPAMGLGWLKPDPNDPNSDWGFNAPGIVRKINYGRSLGFTGFVIFELGNANLPTGVSDGDLVNALANGPFSSKVPSCMTSSSSPTPTRTPTPTPVYKTPTPTPSSCPFAYSGDYNCDGYINESDLNALLSKWMTNVNDITGDGKTNESDLNKLLGNWKTI
ncbi:hypothetical protein MUP32_01260 [Candidatus Microgenomates bacterium]|nr:hypothetical protein [Candidatus Microgenomates bacterium]